MLLGQLKHLDDRISDPQAFRAAMAELHEPVNFDLAEAAARNRSPTAFDAWNPQLAPGRPPAPLCDGQALCSPARGTLLRTLAKSKTAFRGL